MVDKKNGNIRGGKQEAVNFPTLLVFFFERSKKAPRGRERVFFENAGEKKITEKCGERKRL